ncbi:MAG: hypothetical protein V1859_04385 [archaeon]
MNKKTEFKKILVMPLKIITTLSLILTHIIGIIGLSIFIIESINKIGSEMQIEMLIGLAIIITSIVLSIIYNKIYLKKKEIKKYRVFVFVSINIIISWIISLVLSNNTIKLISYSTFEGILKVAWKIISTYMVLFFIPVVVLVVLYYFSKKTRNIFLFYVPLVIIIALLPLGKVYNEFITAHFISKEVLINISEFISGLFIFFSGAVVYLHYNYLFYNHEHDRLVSIRKKEESIKMNNTNSIKPVK